MSVRKLSPARIVMTLIALVALVTVCALAASAQETTPRAEVFAGYSWANVGSQAAIGPNVPGVPFTQASPKQALKDIPFGLGGAFSYNFNKWFSVAVDGSGHFGRSAHSDLVTLAAGPQIHFHSLNCWLERPACLRRT